MTHSRKALTSLSFVALSFVLWGSGCSSDDAPDSSTTRGGNAGAAGHTAGAGTSSGGKSGAMATNAGAGGATTDVGGAESAGAEQGGADMGGSPPVGAGGQIDTAGAGGEPAMNDSVVKATVPAGGGSVPVSLPGGEIVTFTFPASAAGLTVKLTPTDSTSIGWPAGQFSSVIKMEPDGTTFADPVVIKLASKDLMVLDFASGGAQGPAEGLPLNATGDGLLLKHFSTLAVVPSGKSCDSTSGWNASADDARCANFGAASTYLDFACKGYNFCQIIQAHCCALPGASACQEGDADVAIAYTESDGNGNHPYCQQTLTSVTPNSGAAFASVVATGTNWDAYYAKDNAVHYVSSIRFFNQQTGVAVNLGQQNLVVQQHTDDRNLVTFTVPSIPVGTYNFAVVFRNGFVSSTVPFTVTP